MNEENKNSKSTGSSSDSKQSELQHAAGNVNKTDTKSPAGRTEQTAWKRFLAKKWAFPAMYMAAAVIILGIMWVYQGASQQPFDEGDLGLVIGEEDPTGSGENSLDPDALPVVTETAEQLQWPVENFTALMVVRPFYEEDASVEARTAAVIQYQNSFMPNMGVSLAREDGESFNIAAAMSGTVTRVEHGAPLVGNLVEITHDDGLSTIYSSLGDVNVTLHQEVKQGQVIGTAGRNELEKDLNVHVYFEVTQNGEPVNPNTLIEQTIAEQAEGDASENAKDEGKENAEGDAAEGDNAN